MLKLKYNGKFKKDYSLAIKRGFNPELLTKVLRILANEQPLPKKYKDHQLENCKKYINMRECHIQPDWLLIYQIEKESLVLSIIRTGTHSDLF